MTDLSELITVLVVTSPVASDPSPAALIETMESVAAYPDIADVPLIIGADGVRPEQCRLAAAYEEKVGLFGLLMEQASGCRFLRLPAWGHQANVMRMLLAQVTTPLVLFMEHDTPFTPDVAIDWPGCAQTLIDGELDLIRFLHESAPLPEHAHLFLDREPVEDSRTRRIPYVRTVQWSQRPHLARTDWYRKLIDTYFAPSSRTMIEDLMFGVVHTAYRTEGEAAWNRFRLAVYADPEPTWQRSYHLDGRAGGEKFEMLFAYPGDTPDYAPAPTLSRVF